MVRITRRDFLKYCSIAAGALGLSASTLMRVENVLAKVGDGGPDVIWIAGAACTGCTMSLLNTVFYDTIDDLLLRKIDLDFIDTAQAAVGAKVDGVDFGDATAGNSALKAQAIYQGTRPYVLIVEGAIQDTLPPGGTNVGDWCRIGDLTGGSNETMYDNVKQFAENDNCLAVLAVGACSSWGGIPGAKGNVTGARGVAFTGTAQGGALVTNTNSGKINSVVVQTPGTGFKYTDSLTVNFTGGGSGESATAQARIIVNMNAKGSGYGLAPTDTAAPTVTLSGGGGTGAQAILVIRNDAIDAIVVTDPGIGYTSAPSVIIDPGDTGGTGASATAVIGVPKVTIVNGGSGFSSNPDITTVSLSGGSGSGWTGEVYVSSANSIRNRTGLASKVINISGCPPHPDWIVGTIAHIIDTNLQLPPVNSVYQPIDYGYAEYQCNAGPCPWRYNNASSGARGGDGHDARYDEGNSRALGKYKWEHSTDVGCIGILGCKGRKTKADCSKRRWNADAEGSYGVNWCVGSRAGCHGCTSPAFPDKVGKFFTFA
jgi:Ni,Fe-hydrogenase I small subunit